MHDINSSNDNDNHNNNLSHTSKEENLFVALSTLACITVQFVESTGA